MQKRFILWCFALLFTLVYSVNTAFGIEDKETVLADTWDPRVARWEPFIVESAEKYNVDPDLIAAIVDAESDGISNGVSYAGAVGLMGIMPYEEGFDWRPTRQRLMSPSVNISWGTAIISDIMHQAGGDLHSALAAYNGGWRLVDTAETRGYAAQVLDLYGRAIASREGIDPDSAAAWTVAVHVPRGYISSRPFVAGEYAIGQLMTLGEHIVYENYEGRIPLVVHAYAVPLDVEDEPVPVWLVR